MAHKEEYAPFIAYFERQWVGIKQSQRRIRKGDDNISWNCFKQVKGGLLKTTSSLEGWHNQFQKRVGVSKPKFNKILAHLKLQQSISSRDFMLADKDDANPKKRTKAVLKFEQVAKAALKSYNKEKRLDHLQQLPVALGGAY